MHKTRKTRHGNLLFVVLFLFGVVLMICRTSSYVSLIKNFVYYIAYPNIKTADNIFHYTGRFASNIKAFIFLHQKSISYEQRNQEFEDKIRNYDVISKEYDDLSKLLALKKIKNTKSVFARISAREPGEWYHWLIIDKGKTSGLEKNFPVVLLNKNKNVLCAMGKIVEIYNSSAKVALITDSNYKLPVKIKNENKDVNCLAEGFGSNLIRITYISQETNVSHGDEIVTSDLSSVFPKDILVGVIRRPVMDNTNLDFKTAMAEVYFDSDVVCNNVVILVPCEESK